MGVFEMVVLLVAIATAGKVAETVVASRRGGSGAEARIRALEAELRANEMRLAQAEEKVDDLGEKLAFVEKLLEQPERAAQLPPP